MSNFPPPQTELIEEFEELEDWEERYDFIIDLGRELPAMTDDQKVEENIVKGCMSQVWLETGKSESGEAMKIDADSDSIIVKGLIVLLLSFYRGKTPAQVATDDVEGFLGTLGLNQHLSPQRRNGLFAMVKRLRSEAAMLAG